MKLKKKICGSGSGRLLSELAESYIPRRSLATKGYNECPKVTNSLTYVY